MNSEYPARDVGITFGLHVRPWRLRGLVVTGDAAARINLSLAAAGRLRKELATWQDLFEILAKASEDAAQQIKRLEDENRTLAAKVAELEQHTPARDPETGEFISRQHSNREEHHQLDQNGSQSRASSTAQREAPAPEEAPDSTSTGGGA